MQLDILFGKIPKESFELLQRNVELRKILEKLYEAKDIGLEIKDFDPVFNEIFRFFFRPLEISIIASKPLVHFLPTAENISLYETVEETFRAYEEFLQSLKDHLELTAKMVERNLSTPVIEDLKRRIEAMKSELKTVDLRLFTDYPYILTNKALKHLTNSIESWRRFSSDYRVFKEMMLATFRRAVEEFLIQLEKKNFGSYAEFAGSFYGICARHFDSLLSSENYLAVQGSMSSNLMDHFYHFRRFYEEMLESSPLNPFATISQMDEAYRRIADLKRKIAEIERRLKAFEVRD